ncbi:MAG: hypothetical protein WEG36_10515 [Gemmatimonadota bacterium]
MALRRRTGIAGIAAAISGISACAGEAPDPAEAICRSEEAAASGLQVSVDNDTYFYADDPAGDQVGYESGEAVLALEPGDYEARVNGSRHPVTIRSGRITRCVASAFDVIGTTGAYYYVLDTLGTQLSYARLGEPLWLFPGTYVAKLNDTRTRTMLTPGDTTRLASGTVVVRGTTDEYYYVNDPEATQLAFAKLGEPLSLLPGSYVAKLNNAQSAFTVEADGTVQIASGSVLGSGTTNEFYYILDGAGSQLGFARLGDASSYLPGEYQFRVSGTATPLTVQADQTTEIVTGTLLVPGAASEFYYVLDEAGTQLGFNQLGTPTSVVPGAYTVRVGDRMIPVTIEAGATITPDR